MEPENEEVSLRYILEYSTREKAVICSQLCDTAEKKDHFVANGRRWLESRERQAAQQESWQNEWHEY